MKRSLLVEADGGPLAVAVAGANVPDHQLLAATLDAIILERPAPEPDWPQHLCLDAGYDNEASWGACIDRDYYPHIAPARPSPAPPPPKAPRRPSRRWVVERTIAWLNQCRAILIRWERETDNYLTAIKLACCLLWYRRLDRLAPLR